MGLLRWESCGEVFSAGTVGVGIEAVDRVQSSGYTWSDLHREGSGSAT